MYISIEPFGLLFELISIVSGGLSKLAPAQLGLTFTVAVGITALCAWICLHYVQLWNKRFQLTTVHKGLTAFACTLTFFFVLAFASLTFLKEVTLARIAIWQTAIKTDPTWSQETLHKTYDVVKKTGKEDFTNFPSYKSGVPISHSESQLIVAEIYSDEACQNFALQHPFLSKVVWASPNLPTKMVQTDVESYFKDKQNHTYPTERAVDLAADHIKTQLNQQVPRVVTLSRITLVLSFLLVQLIPFGLIGYAAYTDIRSSF